MARADRYYRLKERRAPQEKLASALAEARSVPDIEQDFRYMVEAMQPIDAEFTENTFREGIRVRDHLAQKLPQDYSATFCFQGSVTSDTHIRIHSDIDLLALNGRFVSLDPGTPVRRPYSGDSLAELIAMRSTVAETLKRSFPAVHVDDSPGKAISLEGGSLRRKIDVIVGNWWDTDEWREQKNRVYRGVRIVDTKSNSLITNLPFLHNYRIDEKDQRTAGLRKAIRLLKTLKYDAEPQLAISSYDIAAVAWNMPDMYLMVPQGHYLQLAQRVGEALRHMVDNKALRDGYLVPNGTRKVFGAGGASLESLRMLHAEIADLIARIDRATSDRLQKAAFAGSRQSLPPWAEQRSQLMLEHSF